MNRRQVRPFEMFRAESGPTPILFLSLNPARFPCAYRVEGSFANRSCSADSLAGIRLLTLAIPSNPEALCHTTAQHAPACALSTMALPLQIAQTSRPPAGSVGLVAEAARFHASQDR